MPISVKYDDAEFRRVLEQIAEAGANPRPVLKGIGEILVQSTKQRFRTSTSPDGFRWEDNSGTTLQNYLDKFESAWGKEPKGNIFDKRHKKRLDLVGKGLSPTTIMSLSAHGVKMAHSKKPLIGETKSLSTQIYAQIVGDAELAVGSPMEYAAMQQYGGKKADFPHLWGDIPARPFLGLSAEDREDVLDELMAFLDRALGG
jgi:phage gpG-like protein